MAGEFDVELLLFARARELVGEKKISLRLTPGVRVEELTDIIRAAAPALGALLPHCRLAVDQEFAPAGQEIRPGAVLALIPPVSGGAPGVAAPPRRQTPLDMLPAMRPPRRTGKGKGIGIGMEDGKTRWPA